MSTLDSSGNSLSGAYPGLPFTSQPYSGPAVYGPGSPYGMAPAGVSADAGQSYGGVPSIFTDAFAGLFGARGAAVLAGGSNPMDDPSRRYAPGGSAANPLAATGGAATQPATAAPSPQLAPGNPAGTQTSSTSSATSCVEGQACWGNDPTSQTPCNAVAKLIGGNCNPGLKDTSPLGTVTGAGGWLSKAAIEVAIGALAVLLLGIALWPDHAMTVINQIRRAPA